MGNSNNIFYPIVFKRPSANLAPRALIPSMGPDLVQTENMIISPQIRGAQTHTRIVNSLRGACAQHRPSTESLVGTTR